MGGGRKSKGDMWAEKDSHVLKQAMASESVKLSSLYFEFVLTNMYLHIILQSTLILYLPIVLMRTHYIICMENTYFYVFQT